MTIKIKKLAAGSTRAHKTRRARAGLTLIELVLATGLLTVVLLYTMLALMSLVRLNRLTALEITATNAMRSQIEEVMTVARDNVGRDDITNQARAVIHYYGTEFRNEKIALGPLSDYDYGFGDDVEEKDKDYINIDRVVLAGDGNKLTYYFGVPGPGDASRISNDGELEGQVMSSRGVGTMVIYLDEQSVPPAEEVDSNWAFMWKDLGVEKERIQKGFDMNRDGHIDNKRIDGTTREKITQALLNDAEDFDEEVDIVQVPIDITITYFTNETHTGQELSLTRRIIVM